MGSYYSFNQNKNILFDIGARQINLSRIKYIKSKETLLIYINAQISTAQNAMFIFTLTYPSSQYQNAGQLLNPMFEIPQSNITIIEPCLSNYSDMVLLYTDSEILILKSDNFQNQIKQHALFNDGGNLFKKFCFTSNDSKIICASYSGYISIYDINQGKKNEIIKKLEAVGVAASEIGRITTPEEGLVLVESSGTCEKRVAIDPPGPDELYKVVK